jgi:hypothetical protein
MAAGVGITAIPMRSTTGEAPAAYPIPMATGKGTPVRHAQGDPRRAVTELGKGASKDTGLRVSSSGLLAKCASAPGGAVRAPVRMATGRRLDRLSSGMSMLPVRRPADYRVPVHDPNAVVMLSKQFSDPFGGMTVSGASLDTSPGTPAAVRDVGVKQCDSVRKADPIRRSGVVTRRDGVDRDLTGPVTSLDSRPTRLSRLSRHSGHGRSGLLGGLPIPGRLPANPAMR